MAYQVIKIVSIVSFWLIMIIFGLLPICLRKVKNINKILSLINCFTAGLFLATGLVHILPEASELFGGDDEHEHEAHGLDDEHEDEHEEEGHSHGISYPHLVVLLAFTFIFFIEKVLLNKMKKKKKIYTAKSEDVYLVSSDKKIKIKKSPNDEYVETYNPQQGSQTTQNSLQSNSI
jgi:zinc transporter ZupT